MSLNKFVDSGMIKSELFSSELITDSPSTVSVVFMVFCGEFFDEKFSDTTFFNSLPKRKLRLLFVQDKTKSAAPHDKRNVSGLA